MPTTAPLPLRRERVHPVTVVLASACFAVATLATVVTGVQVVGGMSSGPFERAAVVEQKLADAKLQPYEVER